MVYLGGFRFAFVRGIRLLHQKMEQRGSPKWMLVPSACQYQTCIASQTSFGGIFLVLLFAIVDFFESAQSLKIAILTPQITETATPKLIEKKGGGITARDTFRTHDGYSLKIFIVINAHKKHPYVLSMIQ
jgi:hypothetical protein